jgi:glycosyltransferase involved in cell wall biosynthesis
VLRILQLCNKAPYPANDGSSIAIYNMAKGLIENNVELYLLTINTKKHFKADENIPDDFKIKSNYISIFRNTNTTVSGAFLNLFSNQSYFVSRFYFSDFDQRLEALLKNNEFDIIQIEGLFMGVYLKTIKKFSSAKIILRAHNIEHFIWERHILNETNIFKKFYLSLQNKKLKQFELKIISAIDAIVPITEFDGIAFKNLGFNKSIFPCITGVDVNHYQKSENLPVKAKTIFYFGSMDWLPNQEAVNWFLDNCWDEVHKAVPEAKFIIAGRGMPLGLKYLSKSNVLIIENVKDGKAFFQQNQVMIVPLLSGSGLRIKIIEGMAYGKAIVSTTVGAEGIHYTNNENILIADQPSDFSKAVIKLLNDREMRTNLEKNASALAHSEFDNLKVVANLVEFYKELVHV